VLTARDRIQQLPLKAVKGNVMSLAYLFSCHSRRSLNIGIHSPSDLVAAIFNILARRISTLSEETTTFRTKLRGSKAFSIAVPPRRTNEATKTGMTGVYAQVTQCTPRDYPTRFPPPPPCRDRLLTAVSDVQRAYK
jgi:hypothetical protein